MRVVLAPKAWVEFTNEQTTISWPMGHKVVAIDDRPSLCRWLQIAVEDIRQEAYGKGYRQGLRDYEGIVVPVAKARYDDKEAS